MQIVQKLKAGFRLHTVFAGILLFVLLLPLSGGYFFRIYENELVRQTESELIAQGVFISAMYKDRLDPPKGYGNLIGPMPRDAEEKFKPFPPLLDLRTADILAPRGDAEKPLTPAKPFEIDTGNRLLPVMQDAKLSTLASMRILNPQGVVIAGTSEIGMSLAGAIEVQHALRGEYASVLRQRVTHDPRPPLASLSRGTDVRVFIALPIVQDDRVIGVAYLSRSPRNILKALYEERESVFLAGLFILFMTGLIAWILSATIGRPLRDLKRAALQLAAGDRDRQKLPSPPIEELASLVDSFEKMSLTIDARSEYIRSFAMHLAHEFKTPLTAIQGAIELLNDHPEDMSRDQRARFLENISKDTDRLKKLVSRLLELARADVMQPGTEHCDAAALLVALIKKYPQNITLSLPAEVLPAAIGGDILETAMLNLVDNSLQQGANKIAVTATQGSAITIDISDNGPGISENNAAKLFTPFFTTRRETGGTGLGLVITRSLLRAHGGEIEHIRSEKGAHFRITLKPA